MTDVYALIMAGGSGTRFWPASRTLRPKQLLAIAPRSERSLIAQTVDRVEPICGLDHVYIATGAHLLDATRRELPTLADSAFLAEPVPRNTAACIGWGTAIIARSNPDAVVMALPSDHHIKNPSALRSALARAVESAREGRITTVGILPTRPETGYGYVEAAEELGPGLRRVARFVEKPDRQRAEQYFRSGSHYWNGGMFFFRARDMMSAIERHMGALFAGLNRIEDAAARGAQAERDTTASVFEQLESISIDYGIMEKMDDLGVVPADCGWSDLGSWQAAWELSDKDAHDNASSSGSVRFIESAGNLVADLRTDAGSKVAAVVGVEGLCIVLTDDAALVIPLEQAQDVRKVVDALKKDRRQDLV